MRITALALVAIVIFSSCSKSYVETPANSPLVTGNGSNYYMPLAIGNSWTYQQAWKTTITASEINNGYTVNDNGVMAGIWMDSAGNYLMQYNSAPLAGMNIETPFSSGAPFLFIPAAPSVGQTWTTTITNGMTMTANVISTSANAATSTFGYSGCLEMSYTYTYSYPNGVSGTVVWIKYFKKGVGMVSAKATDQGNVTNTNLYGLTQFGLN